MCVFCLCLQYGRSDSYRVATTQENKDVKEKPKAKGADLEELKKEVPLVRLFLSLSLSHTHTHTNTPELKNMKLIYNAYEAERTAACCRYAIPKNTDAGENHLFSGHWASFYLIDVVCG